MSSMRPLYLRLICAAVLTVVVCGASSAALRTFTRQELAQYDGLNGRRAYVAVNGRVYDVTGASLWRAGRHNPCGAAVAGQDISAYWSRSPHGSAFLSRYPVVGALAGGSAVAGGSQRRSGGDDEEDDDEGGGNAGFLPQGPVLSRDLAISLGWLAVFAGLLSALYYPCKKALTKAIRLGSSGSQDANRFLARTLKRLVNWHCGLALLAFLFVALHTWDKLAYFRLTASYLALLAFFVLVLTGAIRKILRRFKGLVVFSKYVHINALITLAVLLAYHLYDKLI